MYSNSICIDRRTKTDCIDIDTNNDGLHAILLGALMIIGEETKLDVQ